MELNDILKELSVFGQDQPVPKQALAEAARQREAITPYLLDAINTVYQKVQEIGDEVCDDPSYDLSYYALFLLAQFREQRAFPILLNLLTLDDEDLLDIVLGDTLTENMPSALYSTFNGDVSALQAVIANNTLRPFARCAALHTLGGILTDGRYAREDAVSFFRERLSALGTGEDEELFGALLIKQIADNDLYELAEDVREIYRQGKADTEFEGDFDDFFDGLYNETRDYHPVKVIEDTAEELTGWACFAKESKAGKPRRWAGTTHAPAAAGRNSRSAACRGRKNWSWNSSSSPPRRICSRTNILLYAGRECGLGCQTFTAGMPLKWTCRLTREYIGCAIARLYQKRKSGSAGKRPKNFCGRPLRSISRSARKTAWGHRKSTIRSTRCIICRECG